MPEDFVTRSEVIVLIEEHLKPLRDGLADLKLMLTEMKATQNIVMKIAGFGIAAWGFRQVVEAFQSFVHH